MAPYFLRNLVPRREHREGSKPLFKALCSLTWAQWGLFWIGWLAWTVDSMDFFSVSVSINLLSAQFDNKPTHDITTAITLTLLFRSVGAIVFGILSDRYGRKWPLVINLVMVSALELGSGFVKDFRSFLAVRAFFGVAMGGIWGLSASTSLENLPVELRGLASGVMQQGYACGYLIAAIINLFLVPEVSVGWRALFWTASGISLFAAVIRLLLPESEVFLRAKRAEAAAGTSAQHKTRIFIRELKKMLRAHWLLCIYAVLFMTGFNFLSHGSQDLYPTYMQNSKGFSARDASVATIIGNCGIITGSAVAGFLSQHIGRRLTIIIYAVLVGVFIPLWILPTSFSALSAGAFFLQWGVGAWGVVPIHLSEMSPHGFRATFPGVVYQLGNMISAASAQIEATGGDNLRIIFRGKNVPDYGTVQGIFMGCTSAFLVVMTIIGPENHSLQFEKHKAAFEEDRGFEDVLVEESSDVKDSDVSVREEKVTKEDL